MTERDPKEQSHSGHASMRPRGLPADDVNKGQVIGFKPPASMRPRGLPADDASVAAPFPSVMASLLQ